MFSIASFFTFVRTNQKTLLGLIRPSSTTTTTTTSTTQKTEVEEKISTISQFAEREKLRNEGKAKLLKTNIGMTPKFPNFLCWTLSFLFVFPIFLLNGCFYEFFISGNFLELFFFQPNFKSKSCFFPQHV